MPLSCTIVDFHLFYDGVVEIQIWAFLTRSQCKVSDTQVTVKACGPLVLQVLSKECKNIAFFDNRDSIRPTKIAEKYLELFDTEWADALETLTDSGRYTEEQSIQILLEFMQVSLISISGGQS